MWPQKGQVVQVWFGRKKRSPRGRKEAKDNLIKAKQSQETSIKSVQDNSTEDTEDIENIKNIGHIEDIEDIEDIKNMEDIENIEDIEDLEGFGNIEGVEKPTLSMSQHLKLLYIKAHMDGRPVNRVLIDNGIAINILPTSMLRKLFKTKSNLTATDVSISGFAGGATKTNRVIPIKVKVDSKVATVVIVNTDSTYNALLGRDWIHSN